MNLTERLLAPVPSATYAQAGVAAAQKWTADYNIACWVRGRSQQPTRLTLLIRYRDGSGEREVAIDEADCRPEAAVLLAARSSIRATGRIEEMTVWVKGDAGFDVAVDELYVQRAAAIAANRPAQVTG